MSIINKKPVFFTESPVINFDSGFKEKLLCDGPTFTPGTSCVYSCAFCYVPAIQTLSKEILSRMGNRKFEDVIIRRKDPANKIQHSLSQKGEEFLNKKAVIYASPLVDIAASIELARETIECCMVILKMTNWDIRLLSKSNLLPFIAKQIPNEYKYRMIYGVSTGTFDEKLAAAFEQGTAKVSKRLESLFWLQDHGYRTFGMVCPILPNDDFYRFGIDAYQRLRVEQCEYVWAEVINVRGDSMVKTCNCLLSAGFEKESRDLRIVSESKEKWENYARQAFLGLSANFPLEKLRFLQYVDKANYDWWRDKSGAVCLGSEKLN